MERKPVHIFYRKQLARFTASLIVVTAILVILSITSLSLGSSGTCLPWLHKCSQIVGIRLPRLLAAISTGVALSYSGLVLQNVTRNPLAEPFILGLSSGALAAVGILLLLAPSLLYSSTLVSLAAFAGSIAAYSIVMLVSEVGGGTSFSLILGGIAVNIAFSGIAELTLFLAQLLNKQPLLLLLLGTFAYIKQSDAIILSLAALAVLIAIPITIKPLNSILYGDEYSFQLGYNPRLTRRILATIASLLTGVTVAVAGIIGFIGLLAPHIARMIMRSSDATYVAPLSVAIGASLLVAADTIAKTSSTLAGIGELPVGIYSSLMGGPFLAYLIAKRIRGITG